MKTVHIYCQDEKKDIGKISYEKNLKLNKNGIMRNFEPISEEYGLKKITEREYLRCPKCHSILQVATKDKHDDIKATIYRDLQIIVVGGLELK